MTSLKSLSPVKMNTRSDLLTQCLEFSQALEAKGRTFNLTITAGDFSFSLDTRGTTTKVVEKKKKKLSPSQVRRNQRRREDFLKRKSDVSEGSTEHNNTKPVPEKELETNKCDICEKSFKSEGGLKTHKTRTHQREILRSPDVELSPLKVSPAKETQREEDTVTEDPKPTRINWKNLPPFRCKQPDCKVKCTEVPACADCWRCMHCCPPSGPL